MTTSDLSRKEALALAQPWSWKQRLYAPLLTPAGTAATYLAALTLAETMTVFFEARLGMILHGLLLIALLAQASLSRKKVQHRFLVALALAPLIRLLSLTMPLPTFPFVYWYFVVGGPLLISAFLATRLAGLNLNRIGLHWRGLPLQILVGLTGLGLGYLEYLILRPEPLADALTLRAIWLPALVLLVFTGLLEEIIFRGVMQHTALRSLGRAGFLYVAVVFAVLHFGYHSLLDVAFVFAAALFFGWVVLRSGSLIGVTLSHGLTNISLFLVFPLLLAEAPASIVAEPQLPGMSPGLVAPLQGATPTMTPFAPLAEADQPAQPGPVSLPGVLNVRPTASATPAPSPTATVLPSPTLTPFAPLANPSPTVCGAPSGWVTYIVQPGDTLFGLSQSLGVPVNDLRTANCLESDQLYAGQVLYVPYQPAPPATAQPTLAPTARASVTPAPSATPSPTFSATPPPSTAVPTRMPTLAPTATLPAPTATLAPSATSAPSNTPVPTATATPTATSTPTATATPTDTATATVTATATPTDTPTDTPLPTTTSETIPPATDPPDSP
jgi:uncharacterized protein